MPDDAGGCAAVGEPAASRHKPRTIGPDARALGGALLPLYARFAPARDLFLTIAAEWAAAIRPASSIGGGSGQWVRRLRGRRAHLPAWPLFT